MRDTGSAGIEAVNGLAACIAWLLIATAISIVLVGHSEAARLTLQELTLSAFIATTAFIVFMAAMCAPVGLRSTPAKGIVRAVRHKDAGPDSTPETPRGDQSGVRADLRCMLLDQIALVHQMSVDGRITHVNELMCATTGFAAGEMIGARYNVINLDLAYDRCWRLLHKEVTPGELWAGETLNRARDGSDLWLSSTIAAIRDSNGAVTGYMCASIDVTERTRLKAEFERSGKLIQLGQLTAIVAHEIRNPLGAIRTANYVLERKIRGQVDGVEPQIERINSGISRCDKIITELLDFSRKRIVKASAVAIDHWVASVVEDEARNLYGAPAVTCEPGAEGIEATFDPDQLRQVLINLLSNAAEAIGEKINAGAEAGFVPHIRVRTAIDGPYAKIVVQDNGPGIDPKNMNRIREPLFTTKSFGVGLGLPAIEKILESHGGKLTIESQFGAGATITASFLHRTPAANAA